jgi:hypothetical protein
MGRASLSPASCWNTCCRTSGKSSGISLVSKSRLFDLVDGPNDPSEMCWRGRNCRKVKEIYLLRRDIKSSDTVYMY